MILICRFVLAAGGGDDRRADTLSAIVQAEGAREETVVERDLDHVIRVMPPDVRILATRFDQVLISFFVYPTTVAMRWCRTRRGPARPREAAPRRGRRDNSPGDRS